MYPNGIPQLNDEVFIAKGTVNIINGILARAKFVEIHFSGEVVVGPNSSLRVENNVDAEGIRNFGSVQIFGDVLSIGHTGVSYTGIGFQNYGNLHIHPQGQYFSSACEGYSLSNTEYGSCTNEGKIRIQNTGSGIWNEGQFRNFKSILIGNTNLSNGITNYNFFSNEVGSSIFIQGDAENGIITYEGLSANQVSEFENRGKISVRGSVYWGLSVTNSTFTNFPGGSIALSQSDYGGLYIDVDGSFENQGVVSSQSNSVDGISGFGLLTNSGFIQSSYNGNAGITYFGLGNPVLGSFINNGEIELINNNDFDIDLSGIDLHNTDQGYIYSNKRLRGNQIINDGIFSTWFGGTHNITFENNGVVEDVHNSMPNIQNNQIRIRPLDGPLLPNVVFFNALDKASSSNTTINMGWYDALNNGNAAALYFFWSNSIYPNSFGSTAPTMWMDATIQSSGQQKRLRINILNSFLPIAAYQEDAMISNESLQASPEFNIYPNPVVNSLKVDISEMSDRPYVFKLYNVTGKEVITRSAFEFDHIELPNAVIDGMYIGMIFDEGELVFRKKIVVARGELYGGMK